MEKTVKLLIIVIAIFTLGIGLYACNNATDQPDASANTETYAPKTVTLNVEWPSADKINQTARSYLSPENLKVVDNSPVPVLVPNDPKMLETGVMMTNENNNWYAFSSKYDPADGIGWKIEGRKTLFVVDPKDMPNLPPSGKTIRGKNIYITDNEIGWRASWNENGIFYGMIYGCDREKEDARCKDETMIRKIAENAVYVGGKGKE